MSTPEKRLIFRLKSGLSFRTGTRIIGIDPMDLYEGDWVVFSPARQALGAELATVVARILTTLAPPLSGTIELFGHELQTLSYIRLQKQRARLGFVQGHGGLLSNRTLRDNIALPLSIHGGLDSAREEEVLTQSLERFDLLRVANHRPHEVDGATRFRACVARALVLSPEWLVVEGIGDFEADVGGSLTWARLLEYRARGSSAAAICLTRSSSVFEKWLENQGGRVIRYRLFSEAPPGPSRSAGA